MKTTKVSKKKFLLGLSLSLVLAMAIGSFAMGETQTPAETKAAEAAPVKAGDFLLSTTDGSEITDQDYTFDEQAGILTIKSDKLILIQNEDPKAPTTDRIVIDMPDSVTKNYISLDGVNIDTPNGPALDVNIAISNAELTIGISGLLTGHDTVLKSTDSSSAGLQKNGENGNVHISISDKSLTAIGGKNGAGIGGGDGVGSGNINIQHSGERGSMTAIGGSQGGAGIGGGKGGTGSSISISCVVIATGGDGAAGIGGGKGAIGSVNNEIIDGVVKATSGGANIKALDGFQSSVSGDSLLKKGITFTRETESGSWQSNLYTYSGSSGIYIEGDIEFPADITVPSGVELDNYGDLTLANGVKLTIDDGATLYNEKGTIPDDDTVICNGTITTGMMFYREGESEEYYETNATYKTAGQVQNYSGLPNPDDPEPEPELNATNDETSFDGWYTQPNGKGTKIENGNPVLVNEHKFYEHRTGEKRPIKIDQPENGRIVLDKDEAAEGDEVGFTLVPNDGYELKEGSVKVTDESGKEIQVTEKDGKYTFTMPAASVTVSAVFELIPAPTPPEPGPEPTPEPTPDPSVNPDGDGSGSSGGANSKTSDPFMGGIALALLGVATTGVILTRKFK